MVLETSARPVYILGAGFSKAIHEAMPVTDELGLMLLDRLGTGIDFDPTSGESFEQWLTLQITPLPFLEGHENAQRAANAARVIAEIARVLDDCVRKATADETPLWLRQLIAIWHQEQAVILTFNYDTLLERSINGHPPTTTLSDGTVRYILGDHVVFPAPAAPQPQFLGDSGPGHTHGSLEILKLHGSLTWFWSSGDATGATLSRTRDKHVFGRDEPLAVEPDFSGVTSLDRYLIPPVTSKDGYYSSHLSNALWRKARALLRDAPSVVIMGYSLPLEDRAASQLVAAAMDTSQISLDNRDVGTSNPQRGLSGAMSRLGLTVSETVDGPLCIADYTTSRMQDLVRRLASSPAFGNGQLDSVDVVIGASKGWSGGGGDLFVLAWNEDESTYDAHVVGSQALRGSSMTYREWVLNNAMPRGHRRLEDFVTVGRLREEITEGRAFTFDLPFEQGMAVAVGAVRHKIERWEVCEVLWAPTT